jgi:hypothetical protein
MGIRADDQPIVINTDRIVTATPLTDGQGTRIIFNTVVIRTRSNPSLTCCGS